MFEGRFRQIQPSSRSCLIPCSATQLVVTMLTSRCLQCPGRNSAVMSSRCALQVCFAAAEAVVGRAAGGAAGADAHAAGGQQHRRRRGAHWPHPQQHLLQQAHARHLRQAHAAVLSSSCIFQDAKAEPAVLYEADAFLDYQGRVGALFCWPSFG